MVSDIVVDFIHVNNDAGASVVTVSEAKGSDGFLFVTEKWQQEFKQVGPVKVFLCHFYIIQI